jgi:hypothetical protein
MRRRPPQRLAEHRRERTRTVVAHVQRDHGHRLCPSASRDSATSTQARWRHLPKAMPVSKLKRRLKVRSLTFSSRPTWPASHGCRVGEETPRTARPASGVARQWHMQRQASSARASFVQHEAHQRTVAALPVVGGRQLDRLPSATGAAAATRSAPGTGRPGAARHAARCTGCACSRPACARGAACRPESTRRAAAAPPRRRRRCRPPSRPSRRRGTERAGGCACAAACPSG